MIKNTDKGVTVMKIAILQSKQPFDYNVNSPGVYDKEYCLKLGAEYYEREFMRMEEALSSGAELLVTIEAFNQLINPFDKRYDFSEFAEPKDGALMKRFSALALKYSAYIVAGLLTLEEGRVYNSAVLFAPSGEIAGIYHKVHLPAGEEKYVTPGDSYEVYETPYGNIGMLVCWDLQYPEAARILALKGADIIVCPTWGCEMTYVPARAYENSVTLAVAMGIPANIPLWEINSPSCIFDNMGRVVAMARRDGEDLIFADIDIKREPAPQYGSAYHTGHTSMRRTRLSQRRPDTYAYLIEENPELKKRYG